MFDDFDIGQIWGAIPDEILGMPKTAFIGLIIGIAIACYEGIFTKFNDYTFKVGNSELEFDKKYLASGIVAVIVTFLTVMAVTDAGTLKGVTALGTAFAIGLAEGGQTIKFLNKRIDLYIKKTAVKCGLKEEVAEGIAEKVEVKKTPKVKEKEEYSTSFEEL